MIKKIIFSALFSLAFVIGCGSDDSEGDGNNNGPGGPENPINNTASEEEFKENAEKAVKVFDDYEDTKNNFVGTGDTGGSSGSGSRFHWSEAVRSIALEDETEVEGEIDRDEIKKQFEGIKSCVSSFASTDQFVLGFKSATEALIKQLKEGKFEQSSSGSSGSTETTSSETTKVESDAAVSYRIGVDETDLSQVPAEQREAFEALMAAYSISGSMSGSYDKETDTFQFYRKVESTIDNSKLKDIFSPPAGQIGDEFPGENDDDSSLDFPESDAGVVTNNSEETIEINLKERTATMTSKILFKSDSEDQKTQMEGESTISMTGGDKPTYKAVTNQTVTENDESRTFAQTVEFTTKDENTMDVKMLLETDKKEEALEIAYTLKAGEGSTCEFEAEKTIAE